MKYVERVILISLFALLMSCGGDVNPDVKPDISVAHQPEDLSLCIAPVDIELTGIDSIVDWINAMPKPLTLACFIASLPRPLTYNATWSGFSLQPAVGRHNPRIFIQFDKLWLSFVPQEKVTTLVDVATGEKSYVWDEDGIQLLEFSLEVESDRLFPQSIKGELTFPVLNELPRNAPYRRVLVSSAGTRTTCGECHGGEIVVDTVDDVPVFRSRMLRHTRGSEVNHAELINEYLDCDPEINTGGGSENNEWYRCQMLDAFLGRGSMVWVNFRQEIDTFISE
jgi:hypothetical protein